MANGTTDRGRAAFIVIMVGFLILSAVSLVLSEEIWERIGFLEMGVSSLVVLIWVVLRVDVALRLGNEFTSESGSAELPRPLGCFGAISMVTFLLYIIFMPMAHDVHWAMPFDLFYLPFLTFMAIVTALLVARRLRHRGESPRS